MSKIKSRSIGLGIVLVIVVIALFGFLFSKNKDTLIKDSDTTLVVEEAGTISIGDQYKKIIINVAGVQIEDGTVDSIVVASSVGDGDVTFLNVKSKDLDLQGGGPNSIIISGNSDIQHIRLERIDGKIRVVVTDDSNVEDVTVYEGSQDVILEGNFGDINIEASDIDINVKNSVMGSLSVSGTGTTIYVDENSSLQSANILETAFNSRIVVDGDIEKLAIGAKDSSIEVNGKVGSINIEDDAKNSFINVNEGASIKSLITMVPITLNGKGTINEVITNLKSNLKGNVDIKEIILLTDNGNPVDNSDNSGSTGGTGGRGTPVVTVSGGTTSPGAGGDLPIKPTDKAISIKAIAGVIAPVTGATPINLIATTKEYTATIKWAPEDIIFGANKSYTAIITITPKAGYTLETVPANFFTLVGATKVTNAANTGVVTAVFPVTDSILVSAINITGKDGATTITTDKGTLQMSAEVLPTDASNKAVTWSVTNEDGTATDKATINASGLLKAEKNGDVKVKATSVSTPSIKKEIAIGISNQLLPSTIVFTDGATVSKKYGATVYTNTVSGDGDGAVIYSSGTETTAKVNTTTGEVTIVGAGETVITATREATATHSTVTKTYTLTVSKRELTITGLTAKYNPGATAGTGTVTIEGTPALVGIIGSDDVLIVGTAKGTFSGSSASEVVTVTGLSLTGAKAGNYTLTLPTHLTVDATTVLPASEINFVDGIAVSKVYGTTGYINTVSGAGDGAVAYSSETPATATINSTTGEVTIVGVGTTLITAVKAATETNATVTKTYTLTVTAKALDGITPISGTAKVGEILTAGVLTPVGATVSYQWTICDTPGGEYINIDSATGSTYTILAEDAGKYIKVVATGTGNYGGTVTSDATAAVANAEQAAPTALAGVAPTSTENNDGKITGTTAEMEYKLDTASSWTPATVTEVTGLAAGTYNVRYAAKTGYNASPATSVTVDAYVASTDASLSDLTVDGATVTGFAAATLTYNVELAVGTTTAPTVGATVNNSKANAVVTDASSLPGSTTVVVTAEDGSTTKTYTINFTVATDTTPPVITASDKMVPIANLATWTETVSATDDVDGNVTTKIVATYFRSDGTTSLTDLAAAKIYIGDASVNTSFVIKYNVSDKAGNKATEVVVRITVTKANVPSSISVNNKTLNSTNPYLVDGNPATTGELGVGKCTAHFDSLTGVLSLQDYVGGEIRINEAGKDLRIKLMGNGNKITGGQFGIHNDKGDIHVTSDSVALLEIEINSSYNGAAIANGWGAMTENPSVLIGGKVKLTIKGAYTGDQTNNHITGIYAGRGSVTIQDQAEYYANLTNSKYQGRGIYSTGKTIINTAGNIEIDVSNSVQGIGIYSMGDIEIKQVNSMLITIPSTGEDDNTKFTSKTVDVSSGVAVNKSTAKASYRSGTPYTLGLEGGNIKSATGGVIGSPHKYLLGDEITIESTISEANFDRWTKADGTALETSLFINSTTANSATATIKMPAESLSIKAKEKDKVIDIAAIPGVTAPVKGATPVTTITETPQYTGTVEWSPTDNPFAGGTVYTATITLAPKSGFKLDGVAANFFTVAGATATNAANTGVIKAVFPATAAPDFALGSGTAEDPYKVSSAAELNNVRKHLGANTYFTQTEDIVLSGYSEGEGWNPIGDNTTPFNGTYDGNSKTITGLVINRADSDYQGLFGKISKDATIKNCSVSGSVTGKDYVGGLVGSNFRGTISSCYAPSVSITGKDYVGGLAGLVNSSSGGLATIEKSYASGSVEGASNVGGLVGKFDSMYNYSGTFENSYASVSVKATGAYVGGLVGQSSDTPIENCYATGTVESSLEGKVYIGGLVGGTNNNIKNSYAVGKVIVTNGEVGFIGGLIGRLMGVGKVTSSYYDSTTTEQTAGGGVGKTTVEMKNPDTFSGWSSEIWNIVLGSYPTLK